MPDASQIDSPDEGPETRHFSVKRDSPDPFSAEDQRTLVHLLKASSPARQDGATNTGTEVGTRAHLINKGASRAMRDLNQTHATCLQAKRESSVGMGHRDQEIHDVLDPLCRYGWQDALDSAGDDFVGEGEGFLEIVWDEGRTLVQGINFLDGADVHVVVEQENESEQIHYQVTGRTMTRETVAMAAWGDLLGLRQRYGDAGGFIRADLIGTRQGAIAAPAGGRIVNSEVIHFRMPNPRDPYSGYPDWVAATPAIELMQCMIRHEFDFHFNRGVPELIYEVIGNIKRADWDEIRRVFAAQVGLGNSQKTAAFNYPGGPESIATKVHMLGDPRSQDFFSEKTDTLAMMIATAHGIPPMLANVILPGKIGASNEGPNALLLFQKRKLGQIQRLFSRVLAATLGSGVPLAQPEGAPKKLTREQFLGDAHLGGEVDPMTGQKGPAKDESGAPIYHEAGNGFKTVLDGMTLGAQDTMARMKEPMAGSGRNPADGLLGGASDRKKSDPKFTRS